MALPNIWHSRRVADTSAKSCYICYKPTTGVLITPDNKDFFYVCHGHLKDRGFCSPIINEAEEAAKKRKLELEREVERVKKEYEEKQKKKKDKKDKDKDKEKEKEKDEKEDGKEKDEDKSEKVAAKDEGKSSPTPEADVAGQPRIYSLHKNFYQMRLDRIRNAELAKRNRELLKNPMTFPSVPKGDL
ncbi:MAG: hypothetical protein M1819_006542 [Sarea resinae]|nr:MAG: hypothetical protein M1819_006542 [Sarea resinae]